jgi:hypothetical protein
MKKLFTTFTCLFLSVSIFAQAPQSFNYQGLARDNSGNALISQPISIKASILDGSMTGTVAYSETLTATTNQFGLFTTAIGTGTVISGSFAGIAWSTGNKYLKIEMDPAGGSNFTLAGTTQLLSVPYAMYASSSGNGSSQWQNNPTGINYSAGDVGIGTSTASHALEIVANETNGLTGFADKRHLLHIQNTNSGSLSNVAAILTAGPTGTASGLAIGHTAPTYYNGPNTSSIFNLEGAGLSIGTWGSVPAPINFAIGNPSNFVMTVASNGYVGIGTTIPSSTLHTIGTVRLQGLASNNLLTTALVTDASGNIYTKDISSLGNNLWQTNTVGINYSGGKVGIGTNSPTYYLDLVYSGTGSDRNGLSIKNNSSNNDNVATLGMYGNDNGAGFAYLTYYSKNYASVPAYAGNTYLSAVSGDLGLQTLGGSGIQFVSSPQFGSPGTTFAKFISNGFLGLGTVTPSTKLHVSSGDVYIDDATKGIIMKNSEGQCYRITVGSTGTLTSTLITCP